MTWSVVHSIQMLMLDFPVPMRETYFTWQSNNNTANQIEWVDGSTTG